MPIFVQPTPEAAARLAAQMVAALVRARPHANLGVATGQTMVPFYRELVALCREGRVSFNRAAIFALDEYRDVSPSHPASCRRFLDDHLLALIEVPRDRIRLLDGRAGDPVAECAAHEQAIRAAGGIDVQILGIGVNGHIGFNEPGSPLDSRTRLVHLRETTRRASAPAWGGDPSAVPAAALTMGIGTILEARVCLLLALGAGKAHAVAAAVEGPVTDGLPASALQRHPDARFLLDAAATSGLTGRVPIDTISRQSLD